ncbi:MAG: hypothetical protein L6R39_004211 [Caloplaca ligustica]|nr:MAG: hypothetical protein L6R39_004211 [Caloplaca ligustica]
MTSIDFAAAEKRVLDRRKARVWELQSRQRNQSSRYSSRASSRLPYPLSNWSRTGIEAWDTIKGREGTHPAYRVGQVDAELLDEELLELLTNQFGEAVKYFRPHLRDDWSSEILFGLRAVLFKLSIWDHNASYGAALQNLTYTDARHAGPVARAPTRWQKGCHGLLSVGGRYGWEKWNTWLADREGTDDGVSVVNAPKTRTDLSKPTANVRILSRLSSLIAAVHSVAALSSFLLFLVNGRYRTLLDRILRLRLTTPSDHLSRQVSFEYLNRQLVWHAFTEFLLFLLPLVGISRWRRWLARAWRKAKAMVRSGSEEEDMEQKGELSFLPERTCAICYQDQNPTATSENEVLAASGASGGIIGSAQTDVTNAYEMIPCGCVYCFVCAISRLEAADGEGCVCLRCGVLVKECKPWVGDVVENPAIMRREKTVSFTEAGHKNSHAGG